MSDYLIHDSTLEDIADAIRSKTGGSSLIEPEDMPSEIASISGGITPTGTKQISITQNGTTTEDVTNYASAEITVAVPSSGGSLPSIISKIDGGTFTPSSDTLTGSYSISHNLGTAPTGVVIMSTETDMASYSVRTLFLYLSTDSMYSLTQANTNGTARNVSANAVSGDFSASAIKATVAQNYYKANTTYKWLAWA